MSIQIAQESTYKGNDRWKWSVWLEGPDQELDQIEYVDYILHPTFRDPFRHITDRASKFRLNSAGWGEFTIYLDIKHRNGESTKRKHWLRLEREAARAKPASKPTGRPETAKGEPPVIYVSSSATDTRYAGILARVLRSRGFETLRVEDEVASSLPAEVFVKSAIDQAKTAVFLLSGKPNSFMNAEIETAQKRGIPITPVVIGPDVEVPQPLKDCEIRLKSGEEIEYAAHDIADRLTKVDPSRSG